MMNRIILLPVLVFFMYLANSVYAQSVEEMTGKWKLKSISAGGEKLSLIEMFGTEEVYQVYGKDQSFTSIVGDKVSQGTWKFSKDKKKVKVVTDKRGSFKFLEFKKDYIKYSTILIVLPYILEYEKVE